jgi:hypothetical protein
MYLDWLSLAMSLESAANPGIEPHTSSWSTPTSYLIQARWTAAAGYPATAVKTTDFLLLQMPPGVELI